MRILLISAAPCIHDARPRFTARQLAALGHEVTLLCHTAEGAPDRENLGGATLLRRNFSDLSQLAETRALGWRARAAVRSLDGASRVARRLGWPILARSLALAREFWAITVHGDACLKDELDGKVDVVHAVGLPALPSAGRVATSAKALLIYDAVELERDRNARYAWAFQWLRLALERTWVRRADGIAVPSDDIGLQLARDYGVDRPAVVHNVAPPAHSDTNIDADLRQDLKLDKTTPLAVYIGAGFQDRGIGPAIRAVARLPNVHLAVVGPNPARLQAKFRALLQEGDTADRVHLIPPRPPSEISPYIDSADVAVSVVEPACASYAFSLPNKLFQPVAAGLPVVVGRTPTLRRIVQATNVGEAVDEREPALFADAIVRQSRRRTAPEFRAARALFQARYGAATAASAWAGLYARARNASVTRTTKRARFG